MQLLDAPVFGDVWAVIAAVVPAIALIGAFIGWLLRRARIKVAGWMEADGHTLARVTNSGGSEVQVAQLELVADPPLRFRLRHPILARRERVYPVSSEAEPFRKQSLSPNAEADRLFEFDGKKSFKLPRAALTGSPFENRPARRDELRIWARVPSKRAVSASPTQLARNQHVTTAS